MGLWQPSWVQKEVDTGKLTIIESVVKSAEKCYRIVAIASGLQVCFILKSRPTISILSNRETSVGPSREREL